MAKSKINPASMASSSASEENTTSESQGATNQTKTKKVALKMLQADLHACDIKAEAGYCVRHLNTSLTPRQAAAAKVCARILESRTERFEGGRSSNPAGTIVDNPNDAVRWFLDQAAAEIEAATGKSLVEDFEFTF